MSDPTLIIGSLISPYVRKVLTVCELKGVPYVLDPVVPFFGDDAFAERSPLRRIPVLVDEDVTLPDSSVICQYLEERYPEPSVLPGDPAARGHARWLEEFADTRLGDVFIWRIYGEAVIAPVLLKRECDQARVDEALQGQVPGIMDYLESVAPPAGFVGGSEPGLGDISIAVFFANLRWARTGLDLGRWPATRAWLERTGEIEPLRRLTGIADELIVTPHREREAIYRARGMPLAASSHATGTYRSGPMTAENLATG